MNVRLVLDDTALTAYARLRDVAVGELVKLVEEDGQSQVGVPAACFLTAYSELKDEADRERLIRLVEHSDAVAEILPLLAEDTPEVARTGTHAVVEAKRHQAILATYNPASAHGWLFDDEILELGP